MLNRHLSVLIIFVLYTSTSLAETPLVTLVDRPKRGMNLDLPKKLYSQIIEDEQSIGVLLDNQSKIYLHEGVTARAALVVAGLFDTPRFMNTLAETLFAQGMNVIVLRLSGHGTGRVQDLLDVRHQDWIRDLEKGLTIALLMGEKVTIMGHSTGGTLAALAACKYNPDVDNLVFLAPALKLTFKTSAAMRTMATFGLTSESFCEDPEDGGFGCSAMNLTNPVFQSQLKEKLPVVPNAGLEVAQLIRYTQARCGENFENISQPVFMASTENDDVVNHDFNAELTSQHSWSQLLFAESLDVTHVNLPKSSAEEFAKDPQSHNPYFDSLRGQIIDFISSLNSQQSVLPAP